MQTCQQLKKPKFFSRASFRQRVIAGLVLLTLFSAFGLFWLAAQGRIDLGRWLGPSCGFKQRYNLPCPTCGMTAAVLAFVQGKIFAAFYTQPAAALFCIAMLMAAFLAFLTAVFGVYWRRLAVFLTEVKLRYIILVLVVVVCAGWAVTLMRTLAMGNRG